MRLEKPGRLTITKLFAVRPPASGSDSASRDETLPHNRAPSSQPSRQRSRHPPWRRLNTSRFPKVKVISYILGVVVGSKHLIAQNEGSTHGNELNCCWHERDLNLRNTSWPALEVIHHFLKLLPMSRCFSNNLATWTSRL